jgi:hypothetical protein
MTRRVVLRILVVALAFSALAYSPAGPVVADAASSDPDIMVTPIARDGQVLVSFDMPDGFTTDVRDAIQSGLSTTFSYQIELRQGATWLDHTIAVVTIAATVHFDNLTRRYQMSRSFDGRVDEARPTEDQEAVRSWMTHFERIPLSQTSTLEANGEYYVRVRALLRPRNKVFVWPWGGAIFGHAKFTFIP